MNAPINLVNTSAYNYVDEINDEGNPVFIRETEFVGIFTKEYNEENVNERNLRIENKVISIIGV